jgi:hypothetical protein
MIKTNNDKGTKSMRPSTLLNFKNTSWIWIKYGMRGLNQFLSILNLFNGVLTAEVT